MTKRALLVRAGALGDVLLLRRVVYALRRAGHSVALLAPRRTGGVLVDPGESGVESLIDLEAPEAASLFDDGATVAPALRAALSGFALAVAYSRSEPLFTQLRALIPAVRVVDPTPPSDVHAARWYCEPMAALGIDAAIEPPPLLPTDEERAHAAAWRRQLPARFLAVHPGSGAAAKNWPAERFAAVVRALSAESPWLLVSGPADDAAAATLARQPGAVRAHALPPRTLGALLAGAGLFVGNDSGVTHLAAAFGAPTLALFGPTAPAQWAPLGVNARVVSARGGAMDGLSVDEVLEAARAAT
jgi:heptosyltransferase-2